MISEAEIETNFACKVTYLKIRHEMTKMEQDQLYFDTNFDQHTKIYASFKEQVVNTIIVKNGLSLEHWDQILSKNVALKSLYDEKILFPFVGIVKEQSNTIGETAYL